MANFFLSASLIELSLQTNYRKSLKWTFSCHYINVNMFCKLDYAYSEHIHAFGLIEPDSSNTIYGESNCKRVFDNIGVHISVLSLFI